MVFWLIFSWWQKVYFYKFSCQVLVVWVAICCDIVENTFKVPWTSYPWAIHFSLALELWVKRTSTSFENLQWSNKATIEARIIFRWWNKWKYIIWLWHRSSCSWEIMWNMWRGGGDRWFPTAWWQILLQYWVLWSWWERSQRREWARKWYCFIATGEKN